MQDPHRDQCKGKSPLGRTASQNSPLCNPPQRQRGLRSRRKEKAPLRGANWPHRKSHPGAIKLILQLTSDLMPYPATQQPAQPPGTRIPLTGLIRGPGEVGSSNSASDLVKSTSPRYRSHLKLVDALSPSSHSNLKLVEALSPSYCSSLELVEIQSPSHYASLGLKKVLFPSLKTIATQCLITSSHSHTQLVLTSSSK